VKKLLRIAYYCAWGVAAYVFIRSGLKHEKPWTHWEFIVSAGLCLVIWCVLAYPYLRSKLGSRRPF